MCLDGYKGLLDINANYSVSLCIDRCIFPFLACINTNFVITDYLTGPKRAAIEHELDARINVNYDVNDKHFPVDALQPPVTITVKATLSTSNHIFRSKHHMDARKKIEDLMLDYPIMRGDGARGRLIYEIASCCHGPHRPYNSTSKAVNVRNPFGESGESYIVNAKGKVQHHFMSVVGLPLEGHNERKGFDTSYLLNSYVLDRIRKTGCTIKVCGDVKDYDIFTNLCDPHVLVIGNQKWQAVDEAVEIVKDAIRRHG